MKMNGSMLLEKANILKVKLVSAPFGFIEQPSSGLSVLKGILINNGIQCKVLYLNALLQKHIGDKSFYIISNWDLNSWLFSNKLFSHNQYKYIHRPVINPHEDIFKIREKCELFIKDVCGNINWQEDIIGFSCMFNQLIPSLCISKYLKILFPNKIIVLGGAELNENNSKEILKHCSWINYIFVGESDNTFSQFVLNLSHNKSIDNIKSCMYKNKEKYHFIGKDVVSSKQLNNLAYPIYDDFFNQIKPKKDMYSIEMSRGCSFRKCKFCATHYCRQYDIKSLSRITNEIKKIKNINSKAIITVADLMSPETIYHLPKTNINYDFVYGNLSDKKLIYNLKKIKSNVEILGLGIESFNQNLLKSMNKQHKAYNSICILKWCLYFRLPVQYILLYGLIEEEEKWYRNMFQLMHKIIHLYPPSKLQPIEYARGSYYYKENKYRLKPSSYYKDIYPSYFNHNEIAYYFEITDVSIISKQVQLQYLIYKIHELITKWQTGFEQNSFYLKQKGNKVFDKRYTNMKEIILTSEEQIILQQCHLPVPKHILDKFSQKSIQSLLQKDLLILIDNMYLNIIEPENELPLAGQHSEEKETDYI